MNSEYVDYINSEAWRQKRAERLRISKGRCAVCGRRRRRGAIEVHHLTYARMGNENMEDLLPLCYRHHMKAEELVSLGYLPRNENPIFLMTETIRLILCGPRERKVKGHQQLPMTSDRKQIRNRSQEQLMGFDWFRNLLALERKEFKNAMKQACRSIPGRKSVWMANAFVLYDRNHSKFVNSPAPAPMSTVPCLSESSELS